MARAKTATRGSPAASRRRDRGASRPAAPPPRRLSLDEAFIAILIGAMAANDHVSRDELARAHHIIWSMRRFRGRSGERVNRLIDGVRTLIEMHGAPPVIAGAVPVIPRALRAPAFALAADLVLADGRMERAERRFLERLAGDLAVKPETARSILDAMLVKNSA